MNSLAHSNPITQKDPCFVYINGDTAITPAIKKSDLVRLIEQVNAGSIQAADKLTSLHQTLIIGIAKQFRDQGLNLEELINLGNQGLIKACRTYGQYGEKSFEAHCVKYIRSALLNGIEKALEVSEFGSHPLSLDDNYVTTESGADEILNLHECVQDDELRSIDEIQETKDRAADLYAVLSSGALTDFEQRVIRSRFLGLAGINGGKPTTRQELASELGVTSKAVSVAIDLGLPKLTEAYIRRQNRTPRPLPEIEAAERALTGLFPERSKSLPVPPEPLQKTVYRTLI